MHVLNSVKNWSVLKIIDDIQIAFLILMLILFDVSKTIFLRSLQSVILQSCQNSFVATFQMLRFFLQLKFFQIYMAARIVFWRGSQIILVKTVLINPFICLIVLIFIINTAALFMTFIQICWKNQRFISFWPKSIFWKIVILRLVLFWNKFGFLLALDHQWKFFRISFSSNLGINILNFRRFNYSTLIFNIGLIL